MNLNEWLELLTTDLGLTDLDVDDEAVRQLLDVSRDAAHGVTKIAAPLTTYVLGAAVERGMELGAVTERVRQLLPGDGAAADD